MDFVSDYAAAVTDILQEIWNRERGAVLAGVIAGLMLSFGQALTVSCLSATIADFARWSNDFDYSVFTWPFQQILKIIF